MTRNGRSRSTKWWDYRSVMATKGREKSGSVDSTDEGNGCTRVLGFFFNLVCSISRSFIEYYRLIDTEGISFDARNDRSMTRGMIQTVSVHERKPNHKREEKWKKNERGCFDPITLWTDYFFIINSFVFFHLFCCIFFYFIFLFILYPNTANSVILRK